MRRLVAMLLLASASAASAGRVEDRGLRYTVPDSWTRVPAASDARAAQYRIPGLSDPTQDGELVLFYFGHGQGGSAEDNLQRWYSQFIQPDGRSTRDTAQVSIKTVRGLTVTMVELHGTYRPSPMGGGGAPRPGWRLLGAIVEGERGPWFFRATGPDATMIAARQGFAALLESLDPH